MRGSQNLCSHSVVVKLYEKIQMFVMVDHVSGEVL